MSRLSRRRTPPRNPARALWYLSFLSGIALAGAAWTAPLHLWANLLILAFLVAGLGLGGLLFLSLHYLTGARWSRPLRSVAVVVARLLPYGAIALGVLLWIGISNYPWTHENLAAHPTFWFKAAWLKPSFFLARAAACLLAWTLFSGWMASAVRQEECDETAAAHRRCVRISALFLVVFGASFWLAATDWIMSLEPEWYSTIFAVHQFSGILVGGIASITLLAVWLRKAGHLDGLASENQLHDLGKLLFGLSSFWMYLWFSQYLLIWYANIPEEAVYFARRNAGLWQPLFVLNACLNWGVPFLVLLPRAAKRDAGILVKVAIVLLVGRWLDLYLSVVPSLAGNPPLPGLAELGTVAGGVAILAALIVHLLDRVQVPEKAVAASTPGYLPAISPAEPSG